MQHEQPVAYESRPLTSAEMRYAENEKEIVAIVFACNQFEAYISGRDVLHVEMDYKSLGSIMLKPLNSAPRRLQRMLLRLQNYNLRVKYKKGEQMFLADTLSCAHLPDVSACDFARNLQDMSTLPHLLSVTPAPALQTCISRGPRVTGSGGND